MHGGIDGYSRGIVYLHCSSNNRANIFLQVVENAVAKWSLPSRIRGDIWVKNVDVSWLMLNHQQCDPGRGIFITAYSAVLCFYYQNFADLERNGLLDVDNDID